MKNHLRQMGCTVLLAVSLAAGAQERVTLVAPFPPGGPVDVLSRILADGLQKKTGQTVLVENLPGAAGNLGIDKVKRAKPDGKTWLVVPAGNLTINPTLMPNFPFNIERDFVPVTMLAKAPNVLVASAQVKLGSVRELIAQAHGRPYEGRHVVQVEIDRGLYMDEAKIRPREDFDAFADLIGRTMARIIGTEELRIPLAAQ